MIAINRLSMVALAAAFSAYHVVRGILTLEQAASPWPSVVGMVLYLAATAVMLFPSTPRVVPLWRALFALVASLVLPLLVTSQLDGAVNNGYATWHVASVGTLLTIVVVRGHVVCAWIGTAFLTAQSLVWSGVLISVEMGVTGSIMWVTVAMILTRSLQRLAHDAAELGAAERKAAQWQAAQHAREQERRIRIERTNQRAMPVLRNIILTGGELSAEEREEARLLEAGLRDEIRGRKLLNAEVRASVLAARRRGVTVSLLDEGTIDDLSDDDLARVLETVAMAVTDTDASRLVVRTAPVDSAVAVTVVGLKPSDDPIDSQDTVSLWLEIPRSVDAGTSAGARTDAPDR